MSYLFKPFSQGSLHLRNRIVMAPMCMYSAAADGLANDWHLIHLGSRAVGGCGLIITEATAVEGRGRISARDLGLWDDRQAEALKPVVDFCHKHGAQVSVQLAHAGRKAWGPNKGAGPEPAVAPSALPFEEGWIAPEELDSESIDRIVAAFGSAAARAAQAGCDSVEIHAAHGYLIHQFLAPLSNRRNDQYGGSLANRARFLQRAYKEVRSHFPAERPVWVRISATDWTEGGLAIEETVRLAQMMKEWGVDLIDVSSGGNVGPEQIPAGPGYQVGFADRIRREAGIATGAVGLIVKAAQAETILRNGQADVVLLGRELLRNPYFPLEAAHQLGHKVEWPVQYVKGRFIN